MRRATALVLGLVLAPAAAAHDGPPYPILVDEVVGGFTLSVWTDPDVGEGTFFYYLEAPAGRSVEDVRVAVTSLALDETAIELRGTSELAEPDEPFQQIGTLAYPHRGSWRTRFVLHEVDAPSAALGERSYDLDVTPPGLGPIEVTLYAIPFVAIAIFWLRMFLGQRAHDRRRAVAAAPTTEPEPEPPAPTS